MDDESSPSTDTRAYACPNCGAIVEAEPDSGWITCPVCGEQFVAPADPEVLDYHGPSARDPRDAPADDNANEDELSSLHIRNVTVARRAAIRSYSYMLIAIGVCVVTLGQLAFMTYRHFRYHLPGVLKPIGYVLGIIGAILAIGPLWRRAAAFKSESERSLIDEPLEPPDFSTLSDGSQHVRNLEEMR